jgi:co-chaperonin GroES (HSP10)
MRIEPAGHRVVVKPDDVAEKKGSLYLPQTARELERQATMQGTVLAVGPTAWKEFADGQAWAAVGDRVIFARYGGGTYKEEILENGVRTGEREFRLLNDEDIIAVLREE